MITKEEVDILAREMCFYSENDQGCVANCDTCYCNYWRKYKLPAKKVAMLWDKMKKAKEKEKK